MKHHAVHRATPDDADAIGRLLHDFNVEFGDATPAPAELSRRMRQLLTHDDMIVLLAGSGPEGLAVLRFRPAIFTSGLECYLAELYVVPERRGQGIGRAIMEQALDVAREHGADRIELGMSEADIAARRLYESLGFSNREAGPEGPVSFFYERDL